MIAEKWNISRDELDAFGVRSQEYAARATREGRFQNEIIPVLDTEGNMMSQDEGLRETTMESLGKPPLVMPSMQTTFGVLLMEKTCLSDLVAIRVLLATLGLLS
jgi:acetyl-CoA C-acetyltransferase